MVHPMSPRTGILSAASNGHKPALFELLRTKVSAIEIEAISTGDLLVAVIFAFLHIQNVTKDWYKLCSQSGAASTASSPHS